MKHPNRNSRIYRIVYMLTHGALGACDITGEVAAHALDLADNAWTGVKQAGVDATAALKEASYIHVSAVPAPRVVSGEYIPAGKR
jgi:hypothetical protein